MLNTFTFSQNNNNALLNAFMDRMTRSKAYL